MARFRRTYDRSRGELNRLSRRTAASLEGVIRDLRGEVLALIARSAALDAPFAAVNIDAISANIDIAVQQLARRADFEMGSSLINAFDIGARVTPSAITAVGVPVAFPSISPAILTALTAETSAILTELANDLRADIDRVLRAGVAGLKPTSEVIQDLTNLLRTSEIRLGQRARIQSAFRAETIARTELGRVYSSAQQATSEAMSEIVPGLRKRWVTVIGDRRGHLEAERRYAVGGSTGPIPINQRFEITDFTRVGSSEFFTLNNRAFRRKKGPTARKGRIKIDRMLFPRDPAGSVGNIANCLLPDNEIEGEFLAGLKAFYAGPAYEIQMAGGARLTLTANHPIPTTKGWVSAQEIKKGDSLFKNSRQVSLSLQGIRKQNHKKGPATVQNVFKALRTEGSGLCVGVASLDFDGDGRFMTDNIDIVGPDRILLDDIEASFRDSIREPILVGSLLGDLEIVGTGSLDFLFDRYNSTSDRIPSRGAMPPNGIRPTRFDGLPFKTLRFGNSTSLDAFFAKNPEKGCTRDPEFFREAIQRFASEVALDDVVNVQEYDFSGHVYDFQSNSGLIRCQDIFISNCSCIVVEFLPEIEEAQRRAQGVV